MSASKSSRQMPSSKKTASLSKAASPLRRNVVPDTLDLRDRPYLPAVKVIPAAELRPKIAIPVLDQKESYACTGFALASVLYHLQTAAQRKVAERPVSPYMLYSMARRYDEFRGAPDADTGSSLRGGMKGWYRHGACAAALWRTLEPPPVPKAGAAASTDWWLDAVKRPLGAYYRVDTHSVSDMQVALNELGVLYASAVTHPGWEEGLGVKLKPGQVDWVIPQRKPLPTNGGHAFAIVGYTREGFLVQNSWGLSWGNRGRGVLSYDDWLANAMDCWVAQLGVVTDLHREIAASRSLRTNKAGAVQLASDETLRDRELDPFILDMANNGLLSNTGRFRTTDDDVQALVHQHAAIARQKWGLGEGEAMDVAIYAHGGLVSESAAATSAAKWISALYGAQIFPIFFMWETGLWETLGDMLGDIVEKHAQATGGVGGVKSWWNARLERMLAAPGSAVWGEMKKNADCLTGHPDSGGVKLYEACQSSPIFKDPKKVRLHLIGHSAGSIVHSRLIERLAARGWRFETVNFMAPAVRLDSFLSQAAPSIRSGVVRQYNQFSLSEEAEEQDSSCQPILGYSRSLLYLVSRSFERGAVTPILGLQKDFESGLASAKLKNVNLFLTPGELTSSCMKHGDFDDNEAVRAKILSLIKARG